MSSQTTETLETAGVVYTRNHPYSATVTANRLLTGPGSEKETRHIEIDIAGSGIRYLPGDSAGILPVNTCDAVDLVLERLGYTGSEPFTASPSTCARPSPPGS
jgi:sulfite reductase (NADPH) flavoprotein alpha-component